MDIKEKNNINKLIETFSVKFLNYKSKEELKQMTNQDLVEYCIYLQNKITELENRMIESRGYFKKKSTYNNQGDIFCKEEPQTSEETYKKAEEDTDKSNRFINKLFSNPIKFFEFHS